MKGNHAAYLLAAAALHVVVLFVIRFSPPPLISARDESDSVEVDLVTTAEPSSEPLVEQPPEIPAPPPPPANPDPEPAPEPMPEPIIPPPLPTAPRPEPRPVAAAKPSARPNATPARPKVAAQAAGPAKAGLPNRLHAAFRRRAEPTFPDAARQSGSSGRVIVQVSISSTGEVIGARVLSSSGNAALDDAALLAARGSSYWPKVVDGVPLTDSVSVPYSFRFQGR